MIVGSVRRGYQYMDMGFTKDGDMCTQPQGLLDPLSRPPAVLGATQCVNCGRSFLPRSVEEKVCGLCNPEEGGQK